MNIIRKAKQIQTMNLKKINPKNILLLFFENLNLDKQIYIFHLRINNFYNLSCTAHQCKGTANYNMETGKIAINKYM